jgi:hypothetical protein
MARLGTIPSECVVRTTENGEPWEFDREQVDLWIEKRLKAKNLPAS